MARDATVDAMTMREWARLVDDKLVAIAPGLEYHLSGKDAIDMLRGLGVPPEAYDEPFWSSQGSFVCIWPRAGAQDQARASFISPVVPHVRTRPKEERHYRLTDADAAVAARDIAGFLA